MFMQSKTTTVYHGKHFPNTLVGVETEFFAFLFHELPRMCYTKETKKLELNLNRLFFVHHKDSR